MKIEINLTKDLYDFYKLASDNEKIPLEDGIVSVLNSFYVAYKKKFKTKKKYRI